MNTTTVTSVQTIRFSSTAPPIGRGTEYKSDPEICQNCPDLKNVPGAKIIQKLSPGMCGRIIWNSAKISGTQSEAKKNTNCVKKPSNGSLVRPRNITGCATQYVGKARVAMQVGLTLACLNMKTGQSVVSETNALRVAFTFYSVFPFFSGNIKTRLQLVCL